MQFQKDSSVLIHTTDLQQLAIMEKELSRKPQDISEWGDIKRESFISVLLTLTRRVGLSKGKNARSLYRWGKKKKKNMKHSSPTFMLSDYWFFFHYSERRNTFFFQICEYLCFSPLIRKTSFIMKSQKCLQKLQIKNVHSKFLTVNHYKC